MKVFFDTNVLFSAFGFRGLCLEVFRECTARHSIVISEYVIQELERNLSTKLDATAGELAEVRTQLTENCEVLQSYPLLGVTIRDPTDIPILSAAVASRADRLVTGDKDLLELIDPPIQIVTPRQLRDQLISVT